MSVAVCIHKYITNGYIQSVTRTVHRLCLMLSEIISWITKVLLMKETSILPFAHGENKEDVRVLWRNKRLITKMKNLHFINKRFICYNVSLY